MQITSTKRHQNMASIDRLSALPDDVVCHILSFLPTKISVSTSVLSRRWRFMWAHVPNISFDSGNDKTKLDVSKSFSDIIYRVMSLYKVQNMNTFSLSYREACGEYQLETCITTAIVRNVKKLHLLLGNQVRLPWSIFTYKTLVDLTLYCCGEIPVSSDHVHLPALKRLHLAKVEYESDKSLARLLSRCPVLEDLTVARDKEDPLVCCYVSSPTLHRLVLTSQFKTNDSLTKNYRVKIDTPALRYLCLLDTVSKDFSSGSLTSLNQANVHLDNGQRDVLYSRSVLQFVGKLCNVKSLGLGTGWMEVPDFEFSALSKKFHNLTELVLDADARFISKFLENADNLQVLKITTVNKNIKRWMEPQQVPTCLSSRLRSMTIENFTCTQQECDMVKYLMRNSKVLKCMKITCSSLYGIDLKIKFIALQLISVYVRGSEACQLYFY